MSGPTKGRKSKESSLAAPEAEVEALLRAAQDDLLLNLRVDSHPISSSPSSSFDALDSDLARRFEALKSSSPPRSTPPRSTAAPPPPPSKPVGKGATAPADDKERGRILGDDLAARFAALKGSTSGPNPGIQESDLMTQNLGDSDGEAAAAAGGGGGEGVSDKEVEKVMQWAMDAARLDPSKGDGDDDDDDGERTDDDDDEEEEEDVNEKKMKEMNKGKPRKKFFLF